MQALKGKLMDQLTKLEEGAALRQHLPVNDLDAAVRSQQPQALHCSQRKATRCFVRLVSTRVE
jgi:hypothetical protein